MVGGHQLPRDKLPQQPEDAPVSSGGEETEERLNGDIWWKITQPPFSPSLSATPAAITGHQIQRPPDVQVPTQELPPWPLS